MRLIPPFINPNTKSWGEKQLFEDFKAAGLPDEYHLLHSVNLPDHLYKACGELDFVLISPRGLFVLEVKGGEVSRHDGVWHYEDRYGNYRKSTEGPFNQASSGLFSLREKLLEYFPEDTLNQLTMGWGVVFPGCSFTTESIEWNPEVILDAPAWKKEGIVSYILRLEEYWHQKFPGKPEKASQDLVRYIVQTLRPDFHKAATISIQADEIEGRLIQMTQEQYEHLDIIESSPRILIQGGAGTGKTFLACEIARQQALNGRSVLLVCFSPVLASFLQSRLRNTKVKVQHMAGLMMQVVKRYGRVPQGYYPGMPVMDPWHRDQLLPEFNRVSQNLPPDQKYDVLIVDEAQDLLSLGILDVFEAVLIDGIEKGVWRFFLDPYNQQGIYGNMDQEAMTYLQSLGPVTPFLKINCRNTDPILIHTKFATGADFASKSTGPGPMVIQNYYKDRKHAAELLEQYLDKLVADGCSLSEISILSPLPFSESCASLVSKKWLRHIQVIQTDQWEIFPFPDLTFSSVSGFKGLENRYIVFTDIEVIGSSSADISEIYVGMTRARVQLWLGINESIRSNWIDRVTANMKRYGEDL